MSFGKCLGIGGVAALPVLCFAASAVFVGLGSAAPSGWLASAGYVSAPIALVVVAAAAVVLYRHQRPAVVADDCCAVVDLARRVPL